MGGGVKSVGLGVFLVQSWRFLVVQNLIQYEFCLWYSRKRDTRYAICLATCSIFNTSIQSTLVCQYALPFMGLYGPDLTQASVDSGSQSAHCDQKKWFWNKKIYKRMPRLEPQDARIGGSVAVWEGGSAPATPTQQGTMFGAKDATAEFRIKLSSQMSLEHADAQERAKTTTISWPVFARLSQKGYRGQRHRGRLALLTRNSKHFSVKVKSLRGVVNKITGDDCKCVDKRQGGHGHGSGSLPILHQAVTWSLTSPHYNDTFHLTGVYIFPDENQLQGFFDTLTAHFNHPPTNPTSKPEILMPTIRKLHLYLHVAQQNIICHIRPCITYNILWHYLSLLYCLRLIRHIYVSYPTYVCFLKNVFFKRHILFNNILY